MKSVIYCIIFFLGGRGGGSSFNPIQDGGRWEGGANLSLGNFLIYKFAFDFQISTLQVFF